jgi:ABC-2 type transport system ATP-binding protein
MKSGLRFEDVFLRYGRQEILRGVSMEVSPGDVVGLVGPNGAGKTTMARLATGFTLPTAGSVTVDGIPARAHRLRHGVGYSPEELPRAGGFTVGTLLELRPPHDAAGAAWRNRVLETLALEPLLSRRIPSLSKGQWRTALLAYAAIARPDLVVLDEPEAGLDPGALDRLAGLITLLRETGALVLILSHQLFEIERSCDRVLFVRQGTIAAEEQAGSGGAFLRQRYMEVFA